MEQERALRRAAAARLGNAASGDHPNSADAVLVRLRVGRMDRRAPQLLLVSRIVLFVFFQIVVAATLAATGRPDPWGRSAAWWPITATAANLATIALLDRVARDEGLTLADLYNLGLQRRTDLFALIGVLAGAIALGIVPGLVFGALLFGDAARAAALFIGPLPFAVALIGLVAFPVTAAFAELPTYFGYAMPRLEAMWQTRWRAVVVCALFLAMQQLTLPLIWDVRFLVWRGLVFLPLAAYLGVVIRERPAFLPYLMATQAIVQFVAASQVVQVSLAPFTR